MSALSTLQSTTQDAEATGPPEVPAEQQNKPSPLDEINAITSLSGEETPATPGDAGLKTNAERELQAVPHDIPLTLTDPVLSFLNLFQTTKGRAIVENGLRRAARHSGMFGRAMRQD